MLSRLTTAVVNQIQWLRLLAAVGFSYSVLSQEPSDRGKEIAFSMLKLFLGDEFAYFMIGLITGYLI
tara:strand:+ start:203 stop:403 length:201 start_codon:yes stop_codon:yes gene_type:complete